MKTKNVKSLTDAELKSIFGGTDRLEDGGDTCDANGTECPTCKVGGDSTDCTSEAASGGTTTDTA